MRKSKIVFKGILSFLLCICGVLLNGNTSQASDDGYKISNYKVEIQVHKDATCTVVETITANFLMERHGIKRYIPKTHNMKVKDPQTEKKRTYYYSTPVSNVKVEGAPFEFSEDEEDPNGYLILKIGDPSELIRGEKSYVISYDFDIGDDRIEAYDLFYFDIIGPDWDTSIDSVQFIISFDKDVDLSKTAMYSGYIGSKDSSKVKFTVDDSRVSGETVSSLVANEAITMYVELPEGYYEGARGYYSTVSIIMFFLLIGICIALILLKMRNRQLHDVVQTVEFYPPEGVSSAETGYIIHDRPNDKDMISLLIYLADQGYIEIDDTTKEMTFIKQKEMEESQPEYLKIFFKGLFINNNKVLLKSLKSKFYDTLTASKQSLRKSFSGERKLYNTKSAAWGIAFMIVSILACGIGLFAQSHFLDPFMIVCNFIFLFAAGMIGVFARYYTKSRYFQNGKGAVAILILGAIIAVGLIVFSAYLNTFGQTEVLIGLFAVTLMNVLIAGSVYTFTDYKIDMVGKLLGLKAFIKEAELERIQLLVEENPSYFYNILPYAYVFGLTDKWIKQFEGIAMKEPDWYQGGMHPYTSIYLMERMNHIEHQTTKQMQEVAASRSEDSAGSGGGGGFSGGGSGGGGGSSW